MDVKGGTLNVFVAMPGTIKGKYATWKSPNEVKEYFLSPICKKLQGNLKKKVELIIEKDKDLSGNIYTSMFQEAWKADVYIADLTGANANVYLELGVRWALSDGITVLVCQDLEEIRFNVAANRAIVYGSNPSLMQEAIEKVANTIINGLKNKDHCDSPVREKTPFKTIPEDEYKNLVNEIRRLKMERGEELLAAAENTSDPLERINILEEAIRRNPTFFDAFYALGISYRKIENFDKAISNLVKATQLAPKCAEFHKELGVAYSKKGEWTSALIPLQEAIKLDPKDFEAVSVLGGTYRKIGMKDAPENFDWENLRKARDYYAQAGELNPHDTYPLLNVARLDLIISRVEPERKKQAFQKFEELRDLCQFEVNRALKKIEIEKKPELVEAAYWRIFDHADSLLFSGKIEEGQERYFDALNLVDPKERKSVVSSVISPLNNFLDADVLDDQLKSSVEDVIAALDAAIK
jgi:tetratricopeptide (TPR) repeat protein